ncbi:hypothetical protein KDH_20140 [Dictyobacter sp. S3.2.2.5]|uniref:Uncharacterized protein n=1 Tax=Dictyobacter halimunensis TaxID=3026934 RepID=A0ABQ6FNA6_9CHLR|nr:hypothetical protein KDH_20140 [Dictyobacter sp. S3.2.2.5]
MFPYNNQMMTLMFVRILVEEPEQEPHVADRKFSWQRATRKSVRRLGITLMRAGTYQTNDYVSGTTCVRRLGITLMRAGGKMVYWGTGEPEIEPEASNVSE